MLHGFLLLGLLSMSLPQAPGLHRESRSTPPVGGFHIIYSWHEQRGPIVLTHEIHIYGNGHLRSVTKTGLGPAQEFNPPRNKRLAETLHQALTRPHDPSRPIAPCGAPLGGTLTHIGRRGKKRVVDLFAPDKWAKYGRLVRTLRNQVLGVSLPLFDGNCQALLPGLEPRSRPPGLVEITPARNEWTGLQKYGAARSKEKRQQALAALAWMPNADSFFRFELLERYPTSPAAQALLRYGLAALVRQVDGSIRASRLLKRLGHRSGPDASFHRSLLQIVRENYQAAGNELGAYYRAMGRPKSAASAAKRGVKAARALATIRSDRSPWRAVKKAHAMLFAFLLDMMRLAGLWPAPAAALPRLTMSLTRRALHHARAAFFSRGPIIRGRLASKAKAFLVEAYPHLTAGTWVGLPARYRMDLLNLTGFLRRNPSLYRATGFAGPEPVERSLVRLARLRRFREVERFIDRRAAGKPALLAKLHRIVGMTYCDMERWDLAGRFLMAAAKAGSKEAWGGYIHCLVVQGRLSDAAKALADSPTALKGPAYWIGASELARRKGAFGKAVETAKKALAAGGTGLAHRALGLALAAKGDIDRAAAELQAATRDASCASSAWMDLGRLALAAASKAQARRIAAHLDEPGSPLRGCGQALMAARAKGRSLQDLLARRADYLAQNRPRALLCASRFLVSAGMAPETAHAILGRLLVFEPTQSEANALMARLLLDGDRPRAALGFVRAALQVKRADPSYRGLLAVIVRALRNRAFQNVPWRGK